MFNDSFRAPSCKLAIIISILVCTRCSSSSEDHKSHLLQRVDSHTLVEDRKVSIPIDSITINIGAFQYFPNQKEKSEYITLLNNNTNKLQFYKWPSGNFYKEISIPEGVGSPSHFYIQNLDSIFLVDGHYFRLTQIDSTGTLIKSYRLLNDQLDYENIEKHPPPLATAIKYCGTPVPDNRNPIQIVGDSIFIRCYPWMDPFKEGYFEIGKVKLSLNLKSNQISYFMPYPEIFKEKSDTYPTQFYNESCTYNDITKKFIFSFPADNYLYEVTTNGEISKAYWAGSKYFEEVPPLQHKTADNIKHAEHTFNNFHFERLVFDKYNNVYYRLVWHPDTKNKFSFSNPGEPFRPRLSIIILDNAFQRIGETLLPISVTNTFMFATEEGLFIQSDIDNTSEINFTLFKLKEL